MFKKISVTIFIFILMFFPQFSYADWFYDLWGPNGTLYWLRMGSDPPPGITELDPPKTYNSSEFEDHTLKSNEYLNYKGVGVYIDTESFINQGYIRIFSDAKTNAGIYNDSQDQIGITNSGNIYVGSDTSNTNSYGMYFELPLEESNIINSGNILSEVNFSNSSGEAYFYGIYFNDDLGNSSISNSGTLAAKVNINDADQTSYGGAYGIYTDYITNSEIENSGNILAEVSLSNILEDSWGGACGILTSSIDSSSITNSGDITSRVNIDSAVNAYGGSSGIETGNITNSEIENSGNILAEVSLSNISNMAREGAIGIGTYSIEDSSSITNSGDITLRVNIDSANYVSDGYALGIATGNITNSEIENSGNINVSSNATNSDINELYTGGIGIEGNSTNSTISNSGTLDISISLTNSPVEAYSGTCGIYAYNLDESFIANSGNILSRFEINSGDYAYGDALGIYTDYITNSEIENSGNILAEISLSNVSDTAQGWAFGIYTDSIENSSSITNSGNITSRVNIDSANNADGDAFGIYTDDYITNSEIENSGNINVSFNATNSNINELYMVGIGIDENSTNSTISNSGTLDISTSLTNSQVEKFGVAGISVFGGDITVNNSGLIRLDVGNLGTTNENLLGIDERIASAVLFSDTDANFSNTGRIYTSGNARALSLFYDSKVTLKDGFGYVFHGDPDTIKRPIYVDDTSILNLNSTTLYAYGNSETALGKPYYLIENKGTVNGTWGDLISKITNPDISVSWYSEDRGSNSAIVFNFSPQGAPSMSSTMAPYTSLLLSQNLFSNLILENNILGTLGVASTENKPILYASIMSDTFKIRKHEGFYNNGIYFLPYYTKVNDSGLGADMKSQGFLVGFEKRFGSIVGGTFGGYGKNDVDFTGIYRRNNEDQDVYSFGIYGIYSGQRLFADLYGSYHRVEHDYKGWTGVNLDLRETDQYTSDAFILLTKAGIKFEKGDWGIYPSIGMRWTHWQTESHTTDVADIAWKRRYSSIHEDWFQLLSGVNASRIWRFQNKGGLRLRGGLTLEQTLDDNEVSVAQSLQGQRAISKKSIGNTSLVGNLSLTYTKDNLGVKFGFLDEHNSDYDAFSGYIQIALMW